MIYFNQALESHALIHYLDLTHFLKSRSAYWKLKFIPLVSPNLTHSQLLEGLKNESKYKTTEEGGVEARSLAHNILRGRRACWSFGMGLGKVDKLHSLTRACTQPTQGG